KQRSMIHKARKTRLPVNKSGNLELVAEPVQNHISCACGSPHSHQDQTTNSGSTAPQLSNHFVCSTLESIWKVINGANHVRPIDFGDKVQVVERSEERRVGKAGGSRRAAVDTDEVAVGTQARV